MINKTYINEINIVNFKCFKGKFNLKLNKGINIIVGDNEEGKSTILEAIHLCLSGLFNGKYLKNELTQYLFNNDVVNEYLEKVNNKELLHQAVLPYILIEVFFSGEDNPLFEGDGNSNKSNECGVSYKITYNDIYQNEYEKLISIGNIQTIPIEYYDIYWTSFARDIITSRSIPIKSAYIDSTSSRYQNGSDVYISRIIKDTLEHLEIVSISQAHRKMKDAFMSDDSIKVINNKLKDSVNISKKEIKLSVDLSSKNAWETSLMTYLDDVPFHYIGKGEQSVVKTRLALSHKKAQEANILLLEEPENHLSHSKLNDLILAIKNDVNGKQVIISTHSSFVANKLGLETLILLNSKKTVKLNELSLGTKRFFEKLSGYDTLRLILCKKAILVEGDSDELIIQKAFMSNNNNLLPIECGIDVISVGTSFLRFLEIAEKIKKPVVVVTDNDGNPDAIRKKYANYLDKTSGNVIDIFYDETIDCGDLVIGKDKFNYNTLEPKLFKINSLNGFNEIFETSLTTIDDMHRFMHSNKTECALMIFDTKETVSFPKYILDAIA